MEQEHIGARGRLGRYGEAVAAGWLEERGYRIVDRNWRCARGELDLVAWDGGTLVFAEVKTRAGTSVGHPLEAITRQKLGRIRHLVPAWFAAHPEVSAPAIRIDALAVHVDGPRNVVEHLAGVL